MALDFDEVRFLAQLVRCEALDAELQSIANAAMALCTSLGPPGSRPTADYGAAMLRLADACGDALTRIERIATHPAAPLPPS